MDVVKLFTDADVRSLYALNALLCLLGWLWLWGTSRPRREPIAYRGWIVFWAATGAYYCLLLVNTAWPFWVAQTGLYVATVALSIALLNKTCTWPLSSVVPGAVFVVATTAALDIYLDSRGLYAVAHQLLTAIVVSGWAWSIRQADSSKSMVLLTYALVQLPVFQLMYFIGVEQGRPFTSYLSVTYTVYAALKLALIPVVCFVVQKRDL